MTIHRAEEGEKTQKTDDKAENKPFNAPAGGPISEVEVISSAKITE